MKKLKHIYCAHKGCYRTVKKEGGYCKGHQGLEDQVAAGTVSAVESEQKLSDVIVEAGSRTTIGYDSEQEKAELAGAALPTSTLEAQAQKSHLEVAKTEGAQESFSPVSGAGELVDCGCGMGDECLHATALEISPVAPTPPQEQADPLPRSESALQRLLRPATPPVPPLSPTAIVLDFNEYEFSAIQSENVTPQECKELILMLIAGELGRIVEVEDPLAKSRGRAE